MRLCGSNSTVYQIGDRCKAASKQRNQIGRDPYGYKHTYLTTLHINIQTKHIEYMHSNEFHGGL